MLRSEKGRKPTHFHLWSVFLFCAAYFSLHPLFVDALSDPSLSKTWKSGDGIFTGNVTGQNKFSPSMYRPSCPLTPDAFCDFYFEKFPNSVPLYTLNNKSLDSRISSPVRYIKTKVTLQVGSSADGIFLCSNVRDAKNQFYLAGQAAKLQWRTFNQPFPIEYFQNRCVLLPFSNFQIVVNGTTLNVNEGNYLKEFPLSRRCVVFRTGPNPPKNCPPLSSPPPPKRSPPPPKRSPPPPPRRSPPPPPKRSPPPPPRRSPPPPPRRSPPPPRRSPPPPRNSPPVKTCCSGRVDGVFADPYSDPPCQSYCTCKNGEQVSNSIDCGNGLLFNETLGNCDTFLFVDCPYAAPPPPPPPLVENGLLTTGLLSPGELQQIATENLTNFKFNMYSRYASVPLDKIPPKVNWAKRKYISKVDYQGPECGLCWAYTAAAAVESAINVYAMRKVVGKLSVQELKDCLAPYGDGCSGGIPDHALEYVANHQLSLDEDYPLNSTVGTCIGDQFNNGYKRVFPVVAWEKLPTQNATALLLAVATQPVVVAISTALPEFRSYTGGIFDDPTGECGGQLGPDHNLLVMGYGVDKETKKPFWLARNSWGPNWGEKGYIRIARYPNGKGVCGMYEVPPVYPVISPTAGYQRPCGISNPCGGGYCLRKKKYTLDYRCVCPTGYVPLNNTGDGLETCALLDQCGSMLFNPCNLGTCMNDGNGGYTCDCSKNIKGYVLGERSDGTPTCVPVASTTDVASDFIYTIQSGDTCPLIDDGFGLTSEQLEVFNPDLDCTKSLPVGQNITVGPAVTSDCGLPYVLSKDDTCASVQGVFGLTSSQFVKLNPTVDCASLVPGTAICVQEGKSVAIPQCAKYYFANLTDTCKSIYNSNDLMAAAFYTLNPGINCDNILPGEQVCVYPYQPQSSACKACLKTYRVKRGDTCSSIITDYYHCSNALFRCMNGLISCQSTKLPVGYKLCIPWWKSTSKSCWVSQI